MGKLVYLVCFAVFLVLQLQWASGAYSNSCNKTVLVKNGEELGLRGGLLPDGNFRASSYSDSQHSPERGRLDQKASGNQASSWCSKYRDKNQWLSITLVNVSELSHITTQGQYDPNNKTSNYSVSWVTEYSVQYSNDNKTFYSIDYKYERPLVFTGNKDGDSVVCNTLPYPVKAKYVRVHPVSWNTSICLRVGLFGQSVPANSTNPAFITPNDMPDHETWWWWIFFWVVLASLLLIFFIGLLMYCCIIRRRLQPQEKVLKEKSIRAPIHRKPEASFVNSAYDMTVISSQTSIPGTPTTVEETGDEIQEVTAEFTADEQDNQRGIVGFSVMDDADDKDGDDIANGEVNWEEYRQRAKKRTEHAYENVDLKKIP